MTDRTSRLRLIMELNNLAASGPPEKVAMLEKMLTGGITVDEHVRSIIKARDFVFAGDRTHLSVRGIDSALRNIDKPRKYDFQDIDVYEQDAIRILTWEFPTSVTCDAEKVISGEEEAVGSYHYYRCYDCAEPLFLKVRGKELRVEGKGPCKSNMVYSVDIDFPTGEILADDWPEGFNEWMDLEGLGGEQNKTAFEGRSINYMIGVREKTEQYAAVNIAHFFVGNSSPRIIQGADGSLFIYPDEPEPDGKKLASICTDLWWATLLDISKWKFMMTEVGLSNDDIEKKLAEMREDRKVFKIEPGTYRFEYQNIERGARTGDDEMVRRVTGRKIS